MSAKKPLFAFFGTSKLSVYVLDTLEKHGMLPALVITAPDKPRGRGLESTPSPVKVWAEAHSIDVLTPEKLKDENFIAELSNTEWDVFIVAAYAKLIPKQLLDMPRRRCVNVHPSMLPKFRGPSPIISAILADERETGVTIMQMEETMDTGAILAQARIEIAQEDWPPTNTILEEMLFTEGGNLLAETLPEWISGTVTPAPQDDSRATYTKKFSSDDALIDLKNGDARQNFLKIRAYDSGPRAYYFAEKNDKNVRVIITGAEFNEGKLTITHVIPEGKKEMDYADFLR